MKKLVIGTSILLTLVSAVLFRNYFVNENFISNYNNGIYREKDVAGLFFLNVEICKAYYNRGNIYYKTDDFDRAIENYNRALEYNPSGELEISIRINLALAKLGKLRQNTPQDWEEILEILRDARRGLYINEVAHEFDDNGRSVTAEELEEEIRRMEEQVEEQMEKENPQNGDGGEGEGDDEGGGDDEDGGGGEGGGEGGQPRDPEEERREQEIRDQQERSGESREEHLGGEGGGGGYYEKPW